MSGALFLWFDWLTCCRDQNNGFTYDHLQVAFHIRLERKPACDRLELTIQQPGHLTTCSRHWHLNTTPKHTYMIHFSWRPISITWYKQIILNISITHLLGDFKRNQCRQYVYPFAHSSWAYQSKIDILKKTAKPRWKIRIDFKPDQLIFFLPTQDTIYLERLSQYGYSQINTAIKQTTAYHTVQHVSILQKL